MLSRASTPRQLRVPRNASRATYLVKQLERAMRVQLDVIIGAEGLTTLQYTALSVLALHPGMPSAKLARHSFVTPQAANEMTLALERKGLLKRRGDPVNRRIVALHLTAAGRALLSKCDAHVDALEARMLGALPRGDRRRFVEMMRACIGALREG